MKKYTIMRKNRNTEDTSHILFDTYEDAVLQFPADNWEVVELDIKTAEKPYREPELKFGDLVVPEDGPDTWQGNGWMYAPENYNDGQPFMIVKNDTGNDSWRSRSALPERIKAVKRP